MLDETNNFLLIQGQLPVVQEITGDLYNVDEDILKSIYIYINIGPHKKVGAHCAWEEFSDRLANRQQYCMTGMRD